MGEPSRRVIASGLTFERTPDTTKIHAERDFVTTLALFICRPLWSFRYELGLVGVVVLSWAALVRLMGSVIGLTTGAVVAGVVVIGVVAGLLLRLRFRSSLFRLLRARRVHRQWASACRYAFVVTMSDRTPEITKVVEMPAGEVLSVRMPPSMSTLPLADASEVLASGLGVREVVVERDADRADRASVRIVRRDPLADPTPLVWPNLGGSDVSGSPLSVWDPVPVGIDEMGSVVELSLPFRMVLFGAETGGGKSVAMSQLVATAALDPGCELTLFDGKQVELAFWRSCATRVVGPSVADAIAGLQGLKAEMEARYAVLLAAGKRKIERGDGMALQVVVIDELAFYLTMGERKENQEFERLLRDLVARGRAAGIVVIAATQKPSHDIVPTSIRDLFAIRWALRCTTPQASDTILGAGWSSRGFSASTIDVGTRGLGYLLHEGSEPVRLRSFCLTDVDLISLATRGAALRGAAGQGPAVTAPAVTDALTPTASPLRPAA